MSAIGVDVFGDDTTITVKLAEDPAGFIIDIIGISALGKRSRGLVRRGVNIDNLQNLPTSPFLRIGVDVFAGDTQRT